jgi:hypothetical protein
MTTFEVGRHEVRVWVEDGRWHVAVDGAQFQLWFVTQADAWAAGIREAERIDRAVA